MNDAWFWRYDRLFGIDTIPSRLLFFLMINQTAMHLELLNSESVSPRLHVKYKPVCPFVPPSSSRPRRRTERVPSMSLTHGPLPQMKHDILLHLFYILLQVLIVLGILGFATAIK